MLIVAGDAEEIETIESIWGLDATYINVVNSNYNSNRLSLMQQYNAHMSQPLNLN